MATISEMRLYLMGQYPNSLNWQERVSNMKTRQVVAVYQKMSKNPRKDPDPNYHQINMFEYLASLNQTRTEVKV